MNIKKNKGITIIALILTIVILLIISGVVISNMNTGDKFKKYQYMRADIEAIEDSILVYYHKYGELPIKGNKLNNINLNGQASSADNSNYYEVDLEKVGNITLNYGKKNDNTDMYIINEQSHEVYYLKGIEYEGELKFK